MAIDITALYCCLDDFCKVFEDWEAHRLIPSQTTRQRTGKLSRAEMLFIVVLFHLSPYKNFKVFYLYGIGAQYRACFDELPHYDRFVSLMPRLFVELYAEVGDGLTGRRRRIVGVFEPPLLQQRSDTPCPMLPWSSCFNQGRLPTRSPRCCATERAPCWPKRSRPRWPNFSPSMSI